MPFRQPFRLRDAVEVGDVDHLRRLVGDRLHEVGVIVPEGGGGDAGAEIEESSPVLRPQIRATSLSTKARSARALVGIRAGITGTLSAGTGRARRAHRGAGRPGRDDVPENRSGSARPAGGSDHNMGPADWSAAASSGGSPAMALNRSSATVAAVMSGQGHARGAAWPACAAELQPNQVQHAIKPRPPLIRPSRTGRAVVAICGRPLAFWELPIRVRPATPATSARPAEQAEALAAAATWPGGGDFTLARRAVRWWMLRGGLQASRTRRRWRCWPEGAPGTDARLLRIPRIRQPARRRGCRHHRLPPVILRRRTSPEMPSGAERTCHPPAAPAALPPAPARTARPSGRTGRS